MAEQVVGAARFPLFSHSSVKTWPKTVRCKTKKKTAFSAVLSFSWMDAALWCVLRKLTAVQHPPHYSQVGSFILFYHLFMVMSYSDRLETIQMGAFTGWIREI